MPDPSEHVTAVSPSGTVHALKEDEPKTLRGRTARLSQGWAYTGSLKGSWDEDFPPPYEHEAACTICSHNYERKHA
jgi:hypothetical protein